MLRKGLGIDIGTTQISICTIEGGLLLKEPNVAALDVDTEKVVEVGQAALSLAKEVPGRVCLCWPAWDGIVKYAGVFSTILRVFLRRAVGHTLLRPHVMISIPCDLTEAQSNAVEDAVLAAGAARVHFLEAPLCAALGVGLDFSVPVGQMLVHIGASRTEAAVIFLGDMVAHKTAHVGGVQFDMAIVKYMQEKYQLQIGRRTAEQLKIRLGMVADHTDVKSLEVKGRDLKTRERRVVTVTSDKMKDAFKDVLLPVMDVACAMVENTVDEMRADIVKGGIVLSGGGILPGMDQFFADFMGVRATIATNADTAAAEGAAKALAKLR